MVRRRPVQIRQQEVSLLFKVKKFPMLVPQHHIDAPGPDRDIDRLETEHLFDPSGLDADDLKGLPPQGVRQPFDDHVVVLRVLRSVFGLHQVRPAIALRRRLSLIPKDTINRSNFSSQLFSKLA